MAISFRQILVFLAGIAILCISLFFVDEKHPVESGCDYNCSNIGGVVVPHHDLVAGLRTALFTKLAKEIGQPNTIILVSPNHFDAGMSKIQVSDKVWQTTNGAIYPDNVVIENFKKVGVSLENLSFENEHGIRNILADIKIAFPEAQIVPVIIKRGAEYKSLRSLADAINNCEKCLYIASVDFSHYMPAKLAELHDGLTLRALRKLDEILLLSRAEVDSPETLALLTLVSRDKGANSFKLFEHTNSGVITGDLFGESTTHILGWYEGGDRVSVAPSVTFTIGGDMMFARLVHKVFQKEMKDGVADLGEQVFWGTDAGLVNLEGYISATPVVPNATLNNFHFVFPREVTDVLNWLHVNGVSLANNHSGNGGPAGVLETKLLLSKAGIDSIGMPDFDATTAVTVFPGEVYNLVVIGVQALWGAPDITDLIKEYSQDENNRIMIFPHWGTEYEEKHSDTQENLARAWIDAGADLVVGAHPHVVQDVEVYKGRPIVYSLGNLLFDQTFSKETQESMIIAGEFNEEGLFLFALPTKQNHLRPTLLRDENAKVRLEKFYEPWVDYRVESKTGPSFFFPNL